MIFLCREAGKKKDSFEKPFIKTMEKTMKIEGMMCGHCEARVKKTLEGIDGVDFADVNHETDTAVVTLTAEISNDVLKNAVEEQGYTVIEIK